MLFMKKRKDASQAAPAGDPPPGGREGEQKRLLSFHPNHTRQNKVLLCDSFWDFREFRDFRGWDAFCEFFSGISGDGAHLMRFCPAFSIVPHKLL